MTKITIEEDGWVYLTDQQGNEGGLGDFGIDVMVEDQRNSRPTKLDDHTFTITIKLEVAPQPGVCPTTITKI
jgi:hypothetical protein